MSWEDCEFDCELRGGPHACMCPIGRFEEKEGRLTPLTLEEVRRIDSQLTEALNGHTVRLDQGNPRGS